MRASTHILLQIVFLVGIVLCFLVIVLPIIHRLNLTMKRNRSMLLLFPEELVNNMPEIHKAMMDYANSNTG